MIEIERALLNEFPEAHSREWLETNGIGGYASSTVSGAHSRRYHGLLVAATRPPLGRKVLLSKLEESVLIDGERFDLSCNQFPGVVHPQGFRLLTGFRLDPFPIWTYELNGVAIERAMFMVNGENTSVCRWKVLVADAAVDIKLEVRPLLAFRDHHHLRYEAVSIETDYSDQAGRVSFSKGSEYPTLHLSSDAVSVAPTGHWYRNFEYAIEIERGFDHSEDLFQPCVFDFDLASTAVLIASTEIRDADQMAEFESREVDRRKGLVAGLDNEPFRRRLALAADQFIVRRGEGRTVIAGYHWFSDWGRDTMIALPGLTLATGRPEIAKSIILQFSKSISQGMLPNRFPDEGESPDYNTVDATLWYFEAIRAYVEATDDYEFVRDALFDKLVDVIDWHVLGTRYGIRVDCDGLLFACESGTQLTWMDAKIGDWVVTPRSGKPVEIQALWYNALCIMADLANRLNDRVGRDTYLEMATVTAASFNGQFWNHDLNCLYDVINGGEKDGSVRPNQIFAASLRHTMLDPARTGAVVAVVEKELLTPYGLRSLSPRDPNYAPAYVGSPRDRDAAYHQGTVWAWLIGPFVDAYRRVHAEEADLNDRIREMLKDFDGHLSEACVGQISEIFDAEPNHHARGCAAQAWSVAEILRVISKQYVR